MHQGNKTLSYHQLNTLLFQFAPPKIRFRGYLGLWGRCGYFRVSHSDNLRLGLMSRLGARQIVTDTSWSWTWSILHNWIIKYIEPKQQQWGHPTTSHCSQTTIRMQKYILSKAIGTQKLKLIMSNGICTYHNYHFYKQQKDTNTTCKWREEHLR